MTADMVFSEFIFQLLKVYAILSFARRVLMCYSLKELLRLRLVRQTLGTGDTRTFLKRVIQQPFIYIKKKHNAQAGSNCYCQFSCTPFKRFFQFQRTFVL